MANPIAVPGTNVPSGAAVSPGGAQGVTGTAGAPAWTTCTSPFTIPAVGSTVSAPVVDTSWITVGEMLYVDQAGGGVGLSGILQVTAKTSNSLTLLNPTPAPAIPPADATQAGLLKQLSGNTTDFVDGTNTCQNLVTAVQPTITAVRLRSFQALGNNTFEVDQRNVGTQVTNAGNNVGIIDRWFNSKFGFSTMTYNAGQGAAIILAPGTNFKLSNNCVFIGLSAQQATLAAGDVAAVQQMVEGARFRELANDVHSVSIIASTNVTGGLKFALSLRDPTAAHSLVKLCTIPAPNVNTLISLPNIPIWPSGSFGSTPGNAGYLLGICFAAGSTYMTPANDTWQNGNFLGAIGMDNLGSKPVGSQLQIGFIQHEPGAQCSTPMDCPFTQNYDDCLRYFQKTYDYGTKPGTVASNGSLSCLVLPNGDLYTNIQWKKTLAKAPTGIVAYGPQSGTIGAVRDMTAGIDRLVAGGGVNNVGDSGFTGFNLATHNASQWLAMWQQTADTGW